MSKMADDAAIEAEEKRRLKSCRDAFEKWVKQEYPKIDDIESFDWAWHIYKAAWNRRSGEDDAEKQYKKLLVLQSRTRQLTGNHHRLQAKYTALRDAVREVRDELTDTYDPVGASEALTRILDEQKVNDE